MSETQRIWDCHVHVKGGDVFRREFSADQILHTMDFAGIERSVVFAMCKPARECTELTYRECQKAPERLIPFAHMVPTEGLLGHQEIRRAVTDLGFQGVKIHFGEMAEVTLDAVTPTFAEIAALDVPMVLDTAGRADIAAALAERFPQLQIIVAHLGHVQDEAIIDQFIALAQTHANLYLDTSYTRATWKVPYAIQLAGADKVLFGSDGPLIHPAIELMKIRVCQLPAEQEEQVLWQNLARLLKSNE
jgi:predicted TIM-barrel fold metal-dependent hydrolase